MAYLASTFLLLGAFVAFTGAQNCGFRGEGVDPSSPRPTLALLQDEADILQYRDNSAKKRKDDGRYLPNFYLNETQSTQIPFGTFDTYGIVWAQTLSTLFRIDLDHAEETARFFVTSSFRDHLELVRPRYDDFIVDIKLRCADGGIAEDYFYVYIQDQNTRGPEFYPQSLALLVQQPWPVEIPINLQRPIYVRDLDYRLDNARLTFETGWDKLSAVATPLFSGSESGQLFDYKVDLYIGEGLSAGNYNVRLTASDGMYVIPFNIDLNVTEVVCKGQERDPIFGRKGGPQQKILYYNSTVDFLPNMGDELPGVFVAAFDPDDVCNIELEIPDNEFLAISSSSGQVVFTKDLDLADLDTFGRTWIVEVVAKEPKSGRRAAVPLFIAIDFETIHANM